MTTITTPQTPTVDTLRAELADFRRQLDTERSAASEARSDHRQVSARNLRGKASKEDVVAADELADKHEAKASALEATVEDIEAELEVAERVERDKQAAALSRRAAKLAAKLAAGRDAAWLDVSEAIIGAAPAGIKRATDTDAELATVSAELDAYAAVALQDADESRRMALDAENQRHAAASKAIAEGYRTQRGQSRGGVTTFVIDEDAQQRARQAEANEHASRLDALDDAHQGALESLGLSARPVGDAPLQALWPEHAAIVARMIPRDMREALAEVARIVRASLGYNREQKDIERVEALLAQLRPLL